MGVIGCFLCSQEFGCSLMVLGEFLVVQAGFGCSRMFLNVLLVFGAPLWFFVLLTIFRCSLKVLVVLKMVGDVPSWFVV